MGILNELVAVEWDGLEGIEFKIIDVKYVLSLVDSLRENGFQPRLTKVMICNNTLEDIIDQELLYRMKLEAEKENKIRNNDWTIPNFFKELGVRTLSEPFQINLTQTIDLDE